MKKKLFVILVFAVGMMCGVALNQWQSEPNSTAEGKTTGTTSKSEPLPPVEQTLFHDFLPNTAPYWLYLDNQLLREKKSKVDDFFQEPQISKVWQEFCASLPQGVTPSINELAGASDRMHFYLLPPKENNPTPVLLAAFTLSNASDSIPTPPGIRSLLATYPQGATHETVVGNVTIRSLECPWGEFAYLQTGNWLWLCTHRAALEQLWQQPPNPSAPKETVPPYQKILDDHPGTMAALFSNIDHPGEPDRGLLGSTILRLRAWGIRKSAILFQSLDEGGKMTLLAFGKTDLPWEKEWKPIERFPFGKDDPAGLVEAAIRWPGFDVISATATVMAVSGEVLPVPTGAIALAPDRSVQEKQRNSPPDDSMSPKSSKKDSASKDSTEKKENGKYRRDRWKKMIDSFPVDFAPDLQKGNKPKTSFIALMQLRFLSLLFPEGKTIGMNMFGFYNGQPTVTLAIPVLESTFTPLSMLAALPDVQSNTMELSMLPATHFQFGVPASAALTGLNELLLVERDAVSYVFDSPESAGNYLDSKSKPSERSTEIRSLTGKIKSPAQIEFIFSRDFFRYILDQERAWLPNELGVENDLNTFLDELYAHTAPFAMTAGLDGEHWFMETYAENSLSHWLDTALLLWAVHGFLAS